MDKFKKLLKTLGYCIIISILIFEYNPKFNTKKVKEYMSDFSLPATGGYNYMHLLTDGEKKLYDESLENLKNGKLSTSKSGMSSDSIDRVARSIIADHPELFWLKGYKTDLTSFSFITYPFWSYTFNPDSYTEPFANKVNSFVDEINTYNTNDEKIRFVHDKLVRDISYNHIAAEEDERPRNILQKSEYQYAGTAYGALVNSSAVCAGYAKAFQILLNKCGYDCGYVTGMVDAGAHAWNELYLNNNKYCFDVTWDDQGDYYEYPYDLSHKYFALYPSELVVDHTVDELYQPLVP